MVIGEFLNTAHDLPGKRQPPIQISSIFVAASVRLSPIPNATQNPQRSSNFSACHKFHITL